MVTEVLPESLQRYQQTTGKSCNAVISQQHFLAPAKTSPNQTHFCTGGVLLTANEGKIVCSNTLDDRLALVYQQRLPEIRKLLLGANPNRRFFD